MRPASRIWLQAMALGWCLLIIGWVTGTTWLIGAALLVFFVFVIERWDNWKGSR